MTITAVTPMTYTPASRGQEKDAFDTNIEAGLVQNKTLSEELNVSIPEMNTDIAQANTDAAAAASSANDAAASANNKGDWSALTGALNVPAAVNHNSASWVLDTNLADVTTSEPGVSGDWTKILGILPNQTGNSGKILGTNGTNSSWQPRDVIAAGAGTVDAITADFIPDITLSDKVVCYVVSTGANISTTPTFAPDGLTAHTITMNGGLPLEAGSIGPAGFVMNLEYNLANTRWELLNPVVASAPAVWTFINRYDISSAANTQDFTGDFDSTFDDYLVKFIGITRNTQSEFGPIDFQLFRDTVLKTSGYKTNGIDGFGGNNGNATVLNTGSRTSMPLNEERVGSQTGADFYTAELFIYNANSDDILLRWSGGNITGSTSKATGILASCVHNESSTAMTGFRLLDRFESVTQYVAGRIEIYGGTIQS